MHRTSSALRRSAVFVAACMVLTPAHAHVTIRPRESVAGATEKYTMRVPNEKSVATVRIEVEFPSIVTISAIDEKPGWNLEQKKDASGKIIGVTWSGSSIAPREVVEFTFVGRNPSEGAQITWSVIQIYQDGSRSEWTGPQGSRAPAPVTVLKK